MGPNCVSTVTASSKFAEGVSESVSATAAVMVGMIFVSLVG